MVDYFVNLVIFKLRIQGDFDVIYLDICLFKFIYLFSQQLLSICNLL